MRLVGMLRERCDLQDLSLTTRALARLHGPGAKAGEGLREVLERALEEADLVVISGGSSVGVRDLALAVLGSLGEVLLQGLWMKPGKPTIIARAEGKPVVGAKVIVPIVERLLGVRTSRGVPGSPRSSRRGSPPPKGCGSSSG